MTVAPRHAGVVAICIYGWVNGTLAAGVARLSHRFDLDATIIALHLAAFAVGLVVAGSVPTRRLIGRRLAPVVFASALVPFLQAPHPSASLVAAAIMGATGSITLADSQTAITTDHLRGNRTLVYANVGAAITAASGAALVATAPLSWLSVTALPAVAAAIWLVTHAPGSLPVDLITGAPDAIRPNRIEFAGLCLIGLVVAIEFSLSNQIVAILDASSSTTWNNAAPTILFLGVAAGRIAMIVGHTLDRNRVLITSFVALSAGLAVVQTTDPTVVRLSAIGLVGAAIGPLYPLSVGRTLDQARRRDRTSSHSTAAIGSALLIAPLAVGVTSDRISPNAGLLLIILLSLVAAAIVAATRRRQSSSSRQTRRADCQV